MAGATRLTGDKGGSTPVGRVRVLRGALFLCFVGDGVWCATATLLEGVNPPTKGTASRRCAPIRAPDTGSRPPAGFNLAGSLSSVSGGEKRQSAFQPQGRGPGSKDSTHGGSFRSETTTDPGTSPSADSTAHSFNSFTDPAQIDSPLGSCRSSVVTGLPCISTGEDDSRRHSSATGHQVHLPQRTGVSVSPVTMPTAVGGAADDDSCETVPTPQAPLTSTSKRGQEPPSFRTFPRLMTPRQPSVIARDHNSLADLEESSSSFTPNGEGSGRPENYPQGRNISQRTPEAPPGEAPAGRRAISTPRRHGVVRRELHAASSAQPPDAAASAEGDAAARRVSVRRFINPGIWRLSESMQSKPQSRPSGE